MVDTPQGQQRSRVALTAFRERMYELETERTQITRELGGIDIMHLARRTGNLLTSIKRLLDGNVTVLFAKDAEKVSEELYRYLDYAEGHVRQALSDEFEFDIIKKRLYMATTLGEYVIEGVDAAVRGMEHQLEES
jgi:hypothetical protein